MEKNRAQWSNNLVFILAAIGSAIGMGNLWGFPYKMGANGGLPFLLIYLALVVLCGVVVTTVEMVIGRHTGKSPIMALAQLGKNWKVVGAFGVVSAFLIMGFYSVLIGYSVRYFMGFLTQIALNLDGFAGAASGMDFFVAFTSDVPSVIFYAFVTFVLCGVIVGAGVQGGLEKFNKVGIPALFGILLVLIVYNLTLPGSAQGLVFMFTTKGMEIAGTEFKFFSALRTAAGQMLFSLSLGMGAIITYGSYLGKGESIAKNAWIIPAFDTLAALMAGLAIFPAVFATGNSVNAGPGLLFITMHDVFTTMGGIGNMMGCLFYLLVIFAGVSSAISLMEVVTASIIDARVAKGKEEKRGIVCALVAVGMFVLACLVCLDKLGFDGEAGFFYPLYQHLAAGSQDLLDVFDLISEGFLMPLGATLMCVLVGWKMGVPWMKEEITQNGQKFYAEKFITVCVKYITPVLMTFVLVSLFLSYFGV